VDLTGLDPTAHTLFTVVIETVTTDASRLRPPARRRAVLDPDDYTAAQAWGRGVRASGSRKLEAKASRHTPGTQSLFSSHRNSRTYPKLR
jgi:hypothetical protein